jgi:hypothetical protein
MAYPKTKAEQCEQARIIREQEAIRLLRLISKALATH